MSLRTLFNRTAKRVQQAECNNVERCCIEMWYLYDHLVQYRTEKLDSTLLDDAVWTKDRKKKKLVKIEIIKSKKKKKWNDVSSFDTSFQSIYTVSRNLRTTPCMELRNPSINIFRAGPSRQTIYKFDVDLALPAPQRLKGDVRTKRISSKSECRRN